MKSVLLKKFLKRTIFTDIVSDVWHPFDIDAYPPRKIRSFGDANPDKVFSLRFRQSKANLKTEERSNP